MEKEPFYSALAHLKDFYGVSMTEDQFENVAFHAWRHIGNKDYRIFKYECSIVDNKIDLPCNADIIEGVFSSGLDYTMKDNVSRENYSNLSTEGYIESRKVVTEDLYHFGKLIDYRQVDNTLYFTVNSIPVTVLYKGVVTDEEGLPSINFKEKDAIAKYCAFVEMQRKGFLTRDKATFELAQYMGAQWKFAVEDARTPIYLNQNDMDNILNVQSSWDRKRFGLSYKPIR